MEAGGQVFQGLLVRADESVGAGCLGQHGEQLLAQSVRRGRWVLSTTSASNACIERTVCRVRASVNLVPHGAVNGGSQGLTGALVIDGNVTDVHAGGKVGRGQRRAERQLQLKLC